MPEDFEPKPEVPSREFKVQNNPDSLLGVQANETFLLTAQQGHVLGSGGETRGFAKYQFAPNPQVALDVKAAKNAHDQAILDPEAKRCSDLMFLQKDLPQQIEAAENDLPRLQQKPKDDVDRLAAEKKLADLKVLLPQVGQEMATLEQKPNVKAFLSTYEKYVEAQAKDTQLKAVSHSTSHLFGDGKKLKLSSDPSKGEDRSMLSRAVASKLVDNFLGTGSVAEEKFGVDANSRPIGISIQTDGAGVTGKYQGKDTFLAVDYSDPDIQKGLSDLEVNDYITGQLDRHSGNIFIDPVTKKVVGIDNDLAFPDYDREQAVKTATGMGKALPGLPATMHKDTADRIANLDPEALRRQLKHMPAPNGVGKLSDASINGAVDRLKKIQAAVKSGEIEVVNQFDKRTYNAAIDKQNVAVKQECDGKDLSQVGPKDFFGMRLVQPTSYVGAVVVQGKQYELGQQLEPDKYAQRSANSVRKAPRDTNYAEYAKLTNPLREKARSEVAQTLQPESDRLQAAFERYERRLARLKYPSPLDAIRTLRYGGPEGARRAFAQKRDDAGQQIDTLNKRIDSEAEQRLDPQKKDLLKQAGKNAQAQQRQQRPDLALSQTEAQDLLKALNKIESPSQKNKVGDLALNQTEAKDLLNALNKIDGAPSQKNSVENLALTDNEATNLLTALDKLKNSKGSLSLNEQEAQELRQALDNLSPERLQQVNRQSTSIKMTDEDLAKMIQDLKDMDLTDHSQEQKQSTESVEEDEELAKMIDDLKSMDVDGIQTDSSKQQSVKSGQKQTMEKHHTLREDHPELTRNQGLKSNTPQQGQRL